MSKYLRPGKFELIAHRGGGLEAPENTMAAFTSSSKIHPDIIFELDVRCTSDGKVVVIHDDSVDRTTNGTGFINKLSFTELSQLDAGYMHTVDGGKTFPFRGKGVKIPLLSEVFETFRTNRISVEIKGDDPPFEPEVLKVIENAGARARVVLASRYHRILSRARKLGEDICSGFSGLEIARTLALSYMRSRFFHPTRGDVYQIPILEDGIKVFSKSYLKVAHANGKHVHVWTVNDEATMRQLIELGVDGIVTDAPSLLLRVAQDLKKI